jgi:hypothetical protein
MAGKSPLTPFIDTSRLCSERAVLAAGSDATARSAAQGQFGIAATIS